LADEPQKKNTIAQTGQGKSNPEGKKNQETRLWEKGQKLKLTLVESIRGGKPKTRNYEHVCGMMRATGLPEKGGRRKKITSELTKT